MIIEQEYFKVIQEGVHLSNTGKNQVYYAEVHEYFSDNAFRNFSIKIPLKGTVKYKIQNKTFELTAGDYLLGSKQPGKIIVDSPTGFKSICIDIQQETINEAFYVMQNNGHYDFDNLQAEYFFSENFFENKYALQSNPLGLVLNTIVKDIFESNTAISEELFLLLAHEIVLHETKNCKSLNNLNAVRTATKKELLSRLLLGRNFIDDNFLSNPSITTIAMACNMSSFNFFRNFKQAFELSPYQYILKKRLEYAKALIPQEMPLTSIALQCGFPDLFTFSKAFKRRFGVSPNNYKASNKLKCFNKE